MIQVHSATMPALFIVTVLMTIGLLGCFVDAYPNEGHDVRTNYIRIQCEEYREEISCPHNSKISILSSNYGRTSTNDCLVPVLAKLIGEESEDEPGLSNEICISQSSSEIIENLCNGRNSCTVEASEENLGNDCAHVNKYLQIEYTCV